MHDLFDIDISQLPTMFPNETLYSWCGRYHQLSGNNLVTATNLQLFASRYAGLSHDIPNYINNFVDRTRNVFGTAEEIISKHSLLPFYLPFLNQEKATYIIHGIRTGSHIHTKYLLGLPASRVGANHPLKVCKECINEQEHNFGVCYWSLQHQLPSSWICHKHYLPLFSIKTTQTPVHLREWILPNKKYLNSSTFIPTLNSKQISKLDRISRFGEKTLLLLNSTFNPITLSHCYQLALHKRGMLTEQGNLRLSLYLPDLKDYYKDISTLPGFQILQSLDCTTGGFAAVISRKKPKVNHPLKHLLLISYLFKDWDSFITSYNKASNTPPTWKIHKSQDHTKTNNPLYKSLYDKLCNKHLSIRESANQLGISVTTAVVWAKEQGIDVNTRPKTIGSIKLKEITNLVKSCEDKKEICSKSKISLVSLNRIFRYNTELHDLWRYSQFSKQRDAARTSFLNILEQNPGVPVKYIRKIPGNNYMWLYRHDKTWLKNNLPML